MIPEEFRSRVRFLGDVPFEARAMSFTLGDVFVHPARHDGWGIVIQEAMAAGLPVIGTRETGAACDLVEDGRSGFLVPAGSEEMLFRRMTWFVEHPEEIEHFGRRGRLRARCYTPEWGADKFVDMVRETVAGQSSPG
jgi:glycosyltransferase involved in cell wall biosynthesis